MLRRELLSVCQAYAESHGNIFNYSKTVCMTWSLCAGLDPSDFKRDPRWELDDEEEFLSLRATEEEKYAAWEKFVFRCPQTSKEIKFGCGVFAKKVGLGRGGRAGFFFGCFWSVAPSWNYELISHHALFFGLVTGSGLVEVFGYGGKHTLAAVTAVDIQINTVVIPLLHRNGTHIGTSSRPKNGRSRFVRLRP